MDLFGETPSGGRVALAGTSFSDIEAINFGGFVSEYSGLDVTNLAISGGNQFVSIQSYLTSKQFADDPPDFLVWENPIYNNIGEFGDAPLLELIAAASTACSLGGGQSEQKIHARGGRRPSNPASFRRTAGRSAFSRHRRS